MCVNGARSAAAFIVGPILGRAALRPRRYRQRSWPGDLTEGIATPPWRIGLSRAVGSAAQHLDAWSEADPGAAAP